MTMNEEEQEEVLVALIEHRSKLVEQLRASIASLNSQLNKADKDLEDTRLKLARLRSRNNPSSCFVVLPTSNSSSSSSSSSSKNVLPVKQEEDTYSFHNSNDDDDDDDDCKIIKTKRKPILCIPPSIQSPIPKKRKLVAVEKNTSLIHMVCKSSEPHKINYQSSSAYIPSQHKRKLRTLVLSPTDDQLFATSALDGIVNLWQFQGKGSHASLVHSINASSFKQRRWPEDVAWHPNGGSLVSVYAADDGDSQLAVLNLNEGEEKNEVVFLEDKPHDKGIINNIMFMPWSDNCFVTCGCDHAVVQWKEKHKKKSPWKPNVLHRSMHSSAVLGVAGMQQKQVVVSAGADKRIIGFDLQSQKADYSLQIESKCMSVLPNPRDFNLFMVQTGTPQRQLRLLDLRQKGTQIHEFGWNQESSTTQSALINQSWSPDGLYLTSGSADPMIHIFDIRFNAYQPSQSIKAHQKRVFKAAWHKSYPLIISISSDLNIGQHNINM